MRATNKYCYFMEPTDGLFNAKDDMHCVPLTLFKGFHVETGDNTKLTMCFGHNKLTPGIDTSHAITTGSLNAGTNDVDEMVFTITANKQKEVIHDITSAINSARNIDKPMIVVSDDSNSVFASSYITGCANTVTAEA